MREYLVIYERAEGNWATFSPDVPGCIATGKTREEVEEKFREALIFHFEGLQEENLALPEPQAEAGTIRIAI